MTISNAKLVLPSVVTFKRLVRYHKDPTATHTKSPLNAALIDMGCTILFPFKIATFFIDKVFESIMVKDIALKAVSDAEVDFDDMVSAFSAFVDDGNGKLVDKTLAEIAKIDSTLAANLTSEIYFDRTIDALDAFYEEHDRSFLARAIHRWLVMSEGEKARIISFLVLFNVLSPPLLILNGLKNYFHNMRYLSKQFGILVQANREDPKHRSPIYNVKGFLGRIGLTLGLISLLVLCASMKSSEAEKEEVVHHTCRELYHLGEIPWGVDVKEGKADRDFACAKNSFTYPIPFSGLKPEHKKILSFRFHDLVLKPDSCVVEEDGKGFCLVSGVPPKIGTIYLSATTKFGRSCLIGDGFKIHSAPTQAQIDAKCKE